MATKIHRKASQLLDEVVVEFGRDQTALFLPGSRKPCHVCLLPVGDVLDGEKDQRRAASSRMDLPRIQDHRAVADRRKVVVHGIILEYGLARQKLFQQFTQDWNIPLAVTQTEQNFPLRILIGNLEGTIETSSRSDDSKFRIENQPFAHRFHDRLCQVSPLLSFIQAAFDGIDIKERHQDTETFCSSVQ